ncbi:MAG: hypothetical protein JO247_18470 [Chloroflexi bacterium]|nr:hypothetical protein [Chloroflexota bacterium]
MPLGTGLAVLLGGELGVAEGADNVAVGEEAGSGVFVAVGEAAPGSSVGTSVGLGGTGVYVGVATVICVAVGTSLVLVYVGVTGTNVGVGGGRVLLGAGVFVATGAVV